MTESSTKIIAKLVDMNTAESFTESLTKPIFPIVDKLFEFDKFDQNFWNGEGYSFYSFISDAIDSDPQIKKEIKEYIQNKENKNGWREYFIAITSNHSSVEFKNNLSKSAELRNPFALVSYASHFEPEDPRYRENLEKAKNLGYFEANLDLIYLDIASRQKNKEKFDLDFFEKINLKIEELKVFEESKNISLVGDLNGELYNLYDDLSDIVSKNKKLEKFKDLYYENYCKYFIKFNVLRGMSEKSRERFLHVLGKKI